MPEIIEVDVVRDGLERAAVGQVLTCAEAPKPLSRGSVKQALPARPTNPAR